MTQQQQNYPNDIMQYLYNTNGAGSLYYWAHERVGEVAYNRGEVFDILIPETVLEISKKNILPEL